MPLNDLNKVARDAIGDFVAHSLVAFVPGVRGEPTSVSSGTLLATPAGHIVVLTAKHCVQDVVDGSIRLSWYRCANAIAGVARGVANHPAPEVDMALFALWPDAERMLSGLALSPEMVAVDDNVEANEDALVMAGFPAALLVRIGSFRGLTSINYGSALGDPARDPKGRYRVMWTEMETPAGNVSMPHPGGISGGALWRFRKMGKTGMWSPAAVGSIVGVPVAWMESERVAFAEPTSKWREWFISAMHDVDALLDQ